MVIPTELAEGERPRDLAARMGVRHILGQIPPRDLRSRSE
jgi:hypothetical protein